MSMSDNIRKGIENKKSNVGYDEVLRDKFNIAASVGVEKFISRLQSGEIPVDNVADLVRMVGVWKELNGIDTAINGSGGQATLPELDMRKQKILEDTENIDIDNEGNVDISEMTEEEMEKMLRDLDIAQNMENEGGY